MKSRAHAWQRSEVKISRKIETREREYQKEVKKDVIGDGGEIGEVGEVKEGGVNCERN